jgi:hypothetical protein
MTNKETKMSQIVMERTYEEESDKMGNIDLLSSSTDPFEVRPKT